MQHAKPSILITAAIDNSILNMLIAKGFDVDIIPFIKTEAIKTNELKEQIQLVAALNAAIIFTSKKAVEVVGKQIKNIQPNWRIYCVGSNTKKVIEDFFGKDSVIAFAANAHDLAMQLINDTTVKDVYFFCGDIRRSELPQQLAINGITLKEIEVYTTKILPHTINKIYDAVLFFSPSAVKGFFENNTLNEQTVLFAIGTTTADEIKRFSDNKITVANEPDKKMLVKEVMKCFG